MDNHNKTSESKIIVYQILPRLFGNKNQTYKIYGTIEENGCGKFNDITNKALEEIKKLGATHIYYTGVLRHALCTSYEDIGIIKNNPIVIKGRAGSPFAITDYYDVDPDLAVSIDDRMSEFINMIKRTHEKGMKSIIDFVPNHVAREYKSIKKPANVKDLGEGDDNSKAFLPQNNFYYLPGESFKVPEEVFDLEYVKDLQIKSYKEEPAKATGNDLFRPDPAFTDWYETIKLNYGINYQDNNKEHFAHIPDTWVKMKDILLYWASQGVDGFRCDMAEMVPVEFWEYAIGEIKQKYPDKIFIAEIYNPEIYKEYIEVGGFDYLYDKEIFYNTLREVMAGDTPARAITLCWQRVEGYEEKMLRFLENHDEQRLASHYFAKGPYKGLPAMVVAATMGRGPLMVYFGQEAGEPAEGHSGFSYDDGRTTIYDYWGVPQHQKWMNQGNFGGELLNDTERDIRKRYELILNLSNNPLVSQGAFYDLMWFNNDNTNFNGKHIYTYLRYKDREALLIVVNFSAEERFRVNIKFPEELKELMDIDFNFTLFGKDFMPGEKSFTCDYKEIFEKGLYLIVEPLATNVFELEFEPW